MASVEGSVVRIVFQLLQHVLQGLGLSVGNGCRFLMGSGEGAIASISLRTSKLFWMDVGDSLLCGSSRKQMQLKLSRSHEK